MGGAKWAVRVPDAGWREWCHRWRTVRVPEMSAGDGGRRRRGRVAETEDGADVMNDDVRGWKWK